MSIYCGKGGEGMEEMEQVIRIFPQKLRRLLKQAETERFQAEELRLRAGGPFLMAAGGEDWFLLSDGSKWMPAAGRGGQEICGAAYLTAPEDIRDTLEYMSRYSLYAYDGELRQGFLTIQGGHRIGVAGQAVTEGNRIKTIRHISCLNVRVARQVLGCSKPVLPRLYEGGRLCSSLIISPPGGGKTTLLRDLIRQVSNGWENREAGGRVFRALGLSVGVVDERSELGACSQGVMQNDLGIRTDVLDNCPKAEGMMMLIRSMAPQVVAVDEIGGEEDLEAIRYGKNCGCKLLATVHGRSLEDIRQKPVLGELVREGAFERFVLLGGGGRPGTVMAVFDGKGGILP